MKHSHPNPTPSVPITKPSLTAKLQQYALLVRINKPIGILLLLWPTLWALWIAAKGVPEISILFIFIAGTVLMRSAGCAINDYADKDFDAHVERTQHRPLATGTIKPREALYVTAFLAVCSFVLILFTNFNTILLSLVGLILAVIYPYSKRITHFPQVFLGAAFSWGIPMAYSALGVPLDTTTWLVYTISVIWALVYDTMYAMVDREDDLKIGIKSIAILFGKADILIMVIIQIIILLGLLLVGSMEQMGIYYYWGLGVAAVFNFHQLWLIRDRDPAKCFKGFLNNNYFGMIVFIGIVLNYL